MSYGSVSFWPGVTGSSLQCLHIPESFFIRSFNKRYLMGQRSPKMGMGHGTFGFSLRLGGLICSGVPVPPPGHLGLGMPCLCPGDQVPKKDHTAFCDGNLPWGPPNDNDWVGQELPRNYQALSTHWRLASRPWAERGDRGGRWRGGGRGLGATASSSGGQVTDRRPRAGERPR